MFDPGEILNYGSSTVIKKLTVLQGDVRIHLKTTLSIVFIYFKKKLIPNVTLLFSLNPFRVSQAMLVLTLYRESHQSFIIPFFTQEIPLVYKLHFYLNLIFVLSPP